jgi:SAM-dependent methyltransferase
VLGAEVVGALAPITIRTVPGAYPLTPASTICLESVAASGLRGRGLDWGCGTGCLAIAAAKLPGVTGVWAFDVIAANVAVAGTNVAANGVEDRVRVVHADSFSALAGRDAAAVEALHGSVDFVLANPPASRGDDGFSFRRRVVRDAAPFVRRGSVFLIQISAQYGSARIRGLVDELPGLRYVGCEASTPWVPFDQSRSDLCGQLEAYAEHERAGGGVYAFGAPHDPDGERIDARTALQGYRSSGASPLSQWQVHRYCWDSDEKGE